MSNPTTIPELVEYLDSKIREEKDALDRWMGSFAEQPLYAFQWADRTIMDAARMAVYTVIRHFVTTVTDHDGNTDIPRCMASLDRSARGAIRAGLTSASTSTVSNDAERKLGAAWNEIWFGDSFDTGSVTSSTRSSASKRDPWRDESAICASGRDSTAPRRSDP